MLISDADYAFALRVSAATATALLPGLKHTRSLLDVSIRVLEYFERHAAHDAASGRPIMLPPAEKKLLDEVENVKKMLTVFERLYAQNS